ncbi:MAG TPA: DNA recombination protein RmuC [Candidatus Limnocylindria bacterium]|nr:DNA recombination protein RmuC [Candidatus Limnocylindria bacterium]
MPGALGLMGFLLLLTLSLVIALLVRLKRQGRGLHRVNEEAQATVTQYVEQALRSTETRLAMAADMDQAAVQNALRAQEAAFAQRLDRMDQRLDSGLAGQDGRLRHLDEVLNVRLGQNDQKVGEMRETLFRSLTQMREDNSLKLEEMRKTVDETLHQTLSRRLGESFSQVSERLDAVHKGLGEMQSLASGVGDLKKVLGNIKTRGTWGETQLGMLLEEALAPSQYDVNAAVMPGSHERVEYAVRLPGREEGATVYLPIDAKFPVEDYERLQAAQEGAERRPVDDAIAALKAAVTREAQRICGKYVAPPYTTDFAILYLPVEGLYAEVLRIPGLVEKLQRESRVTVAGPTTLLALLNSLQMGFRTLAIEKRSGEVWRLLGQVKGDFTAFCDTLEKTQQRLKQASDTIDLATRKTRVITRRLRAVETLEEGNAALPLTAGDDLEPEDDGVRQIYINALKGESLG